MPVYIDISEEVKYALLCHVPPAVTVEWRPGGVRIRCSPQAGAQLLMIIDPNSHKAVIEV